MNSEILRNEIYQRQRLLTNLHIPNIATVVGCGGTGYWTALLLAMSGVSELILIDTDSIDLTNLNRLPVNSVEVGRLKIDILKNHILHIRPNCNVIICDRLITKSDIGILEGSVFCCTDNIQSQQIIQAYCTKNKLKYQRIGYDGTILNVSRSFPLSFEKEPVNGYQYVPSWVIPAVLSAALGVASQLYKNISITEDIGKIAERDTTYIPELVKEHIRDSYCDNCDKRNCDDCDERRDCDDCYRGDCNSCDRRDCDECDSIDKQEFDNCIATILSAIIEVKDKKCPLFRLASSLFSYEEDTAIAKGLIEIYQSAVKKDKEIEELRNEIKELGGNDV